MLLLDCCSFILFVSHSFHSFSCIHSNPWCMVGHVSRRYSVTCGTRDISRRILIRFSCGGVRLESCGARFTYRDVSARPSACRLDSLPRSLILRIREAKQWEHVFCTLCRPHSEQTMFLETQWTATVDCFKTFISHLITPTQSSPAACW